VVLAPVTALAAGEAPAAAAVLENSTQILSLIKVGHNTPTIKKGRVLPDEIQIYLQILIVGINDNPGIIGYHWRGNVG
jgi:hypothetical protein